MQLDLSLPDSTDLRDCITGRADRVKVALQANRALGKALCTPGNGASGSAGPMRMTKTLAKGSAAIQEKGLAVLGQIKCTLHS